MAIEYIYSNTGLYDKYGRLSYVDGELTNTYDINPEFANGSYSVEGIDNGSAKLATVTDLLTKPMFIAMIILETLPVQRPMITLQDR